MPMLSGGKGRVVALSAVATVVSLIAVAAVVGWGHSRSSVAEPGRWVAAATDVPSQSAAPPPSDSPSPSPSPSPSASPSPTKKAAAPTKKATAPVPVPSHAPVNTPPPAAPPVTQCKSYSGTAASLADVGAALDAAAAKTYNPPIGGVTKAITVSPVLLKAVAWQESGWQSNVVSCYPAYGTLQVTPDTATWMNGQYGTNYDLNTLSGNVSLGAEYLAWLIYYFGHFCFNDHYDISVLDPDHPDLRDAVLAGYNVGVGNVDTPAGLVIPSDVRPYTNAVEADMTTQPWKTALASATP